MTPPVALRRPRRWAPLAAPAAVALAGLLLVLMGGSTTRVQAVATNTSETLTLTASADTYIDEGSPATNFAGAATLQVSGEANLATTGRRWAAVRFPLLASVPADATITSATLRLTVQSPPGADTTVRAGCMTSAWTDTTATWSSSVASWNGSNCTLAGGGGAVLAAAVNGTQVDVDVTAAASTIVSSQSDNGWVLCGWSDTAVFAFHSVEAGAPNAPQLIVTFNTRSTVLKPTGAPYGTDDPNSHQDTYISSTDPNGLSNPGTSQELYVGLTVTTTTSKQQPLLRFDLTESPPLPRSRVVSARLKLRVSGVVAQDRTLYARRICAPSSLNLPGAVSAALYSTLPDPIQVVPMNPATTSTVAVTAATTVADFDVTAIVQAWANGEANLGFLVFQQDSHPSQIAFYSFNATDPTLRPSLEIEYVEDTGIVNPTPVPSCTGQTPTPTPTAPAGATNTPTSTPTNTPTATPTSTPTNTPTPTSSTQLVVGTPAAGNALARSRLSFRATDGTLTPTAAAFVIKRVSDGKFWNGTTGAWAAASFENPAIADGPNAWIYAVTGDARRLFQNTLVEITLRATVSGNSQFSAVSPQIQVR